MGCIDRMGMNGLGFRHVVRWVAAIALVLAVLGEGVVLAQDVKKDGAGTGVGAAPGGGPQPVKPVPSGKVANNIAVITIEGPIDEWTVHSVRRRIARAQEQGADAVVFEVNSPGGLITACILISTEIKKCPIATTVAWVNPMAYSGGAIVSLACKEIVISDGAVLGDALPIAYSPVSGLATLGRDEREKLAAPVIADLIDSARQNHYDEMLVQGIVRRGVELWLVENPETGERLFVNEQQYRVAVGGEPSRLSPSIAPGVGASDGARDRRNAPPPGARRGGTRSLPQSTIASAPSAPAPAEKTDFTPAEKNASPTFAGDVNSDLSLRGLPSVRPNLEDSEHRGKYVPIEYVTDGSGILTMRESELMRYRVARAKVRTDADLKSYLGATNLARLDETWADHAARFLSNFYVKVFLIVVFLVALFVEMMHPGLSLPGGIAAVALVCLVAPPILAGIAGWWTLAAIVVGIGLVAVEIFITPGVVVVGIIGVIVLFCGLAGTFLVGPGGGGMFPGSGRSGSEIAWAAATTLVSLILASVAIGILLRFMPHLPVFNRLVLADADPDESSPGAYAPSFGADHPIKPGMTGSVVTPLRPAGRVQIGDRIIDAVADGDFVDAGEPVRVISSNGFRTVVVRDRT